MTDAGFTSNVADAAAGGNNDTGSGGEGSAFSFMQGQQQEQQPAGNPAWNEFLSVIPSQLHGQVKPLLEKWDHGVQERFTQVQQQYAPWKQFIDQEINPETITALLNLMENDPRALYDQLGQYHGFTGDQGQGGQPAPNEFNLDEIQDPEGQQFDLEKIPEFQQMKLQQQQLQGFVESRIQQEQQQQFQKELETELAGIKEKNPNVNEQILLSIAYTNGVTPTEALKVYEEQVQSLLQGNQRPNAPTVLSPTGGVPLTQPTKVSELNSQQRRSLVQDYLERAASQNN